MISLTFAMLLAAIPAPLTLSLLAVVPVGSIVLDLHLADRRAWVAETESDAWHAGALDDPLPHARQSLMPMRQSPSDLPDRWDTAGLAAVELGSRARHRLGEAVGTDAQRARWNTPTGQFWLIVEALGDLDEPCSHCAAPEEGERPHAGCPGCCCPCGDPPPLPAGVEGHAIAGRTR
jgi:hypothetical protein